MSLPDPALTAREALEALYRAVIEPLNADAIGRHFADSYEQVTDGREIDLAGFRDHIAHLAGRFTRVDILPFLDVIEQGDAIAVRYRVHARGHSPGDAVSGEMIAMWWLENGRAVRCVEMTREDGTGRPAPEASAGSAGAPGSPG